MIGNTFDLFGQPQVNKMDGEEVRSSLKTLEVVEKRNRELFE